MLGLFCKPIYSGLMGLHIMYVFGGDHIPIFEFWFRWTIFTTPHYNLMGTAIPLTSQVFKMAMWMRLWGGSSPKRTLLVSNGKAIFKLWTGRLVRSQNPSSVKTTKRYSDTETDLGKWDFKEHLRLRAHSPWIYVQSLIMFCHCSSLFLWNGISQ